jgi:hypothetical protein
MSWRIEDGVNGTSVLFLFVSCVPSMPEPQIPASYFPRYILHTSKTAELVWVLVLGKGRTFTSKILAPAGKKNIIGSSDPLHTYLISSKLGR